MIVGAIMVEVIQRREQAVQSVVWKAREDDRDGERERERREEWSSSWPSKEEPGEEGGEVRVCRARRAVGYDAELRGL